MSSNDAVVVFVWMLMRRMRRENGGGGGDHKGFVLQTIDMRGLGIRGLDPNLFGNASVMVAAHVPRGRPQAAAAAAEDGERERQGGDGDGDNDDDDDAAAAAGDMAWSVCRLSTLVHFIYLTDSRRLH